MPDSLWYQEGLPFQCSQCGDCCTGAPGYVWVNRDEIAALAKHLQLSVEDFSTQFVRNVGVRKSLVEYSDGDCVFFDHHERKCTVYEARPRQCKTWPFWDSNIRTPAAWKHTCEVCPGSGVGPVITLEEILRQAAVVKL